MHSGPSYLIVTSKANAKERDGETQTAVLPPFNAGSWECFLEREGKAGLYIYSNSDKRGDSQLISGLSIPST